MKHKLIMILGILLMGLHASPQQSNTLPLVSIEAKDVAVADLLLRIEKQTSFHFYFDSTSFDSAHVSVSLQQVRLDKALEQAFNGTDFNFTLDSNRHVFVTKAQKLNFALPPGFFSNGKVDKSQPAQAYVAEQETRDEIVPERKSQLENKLYEIGQKSAPTNQNVVALAGYVKDAKSGEPIAGASVFIEKPRIGVTTDQYGYYSLSVPKGRHILNIQSIGMKDTRRQVMLYNDGKMNVDMQGTVLTLKGVVISAAKMSNIKGTQMGLQKIDIKTIKQIPVVFGEADILRVVTTLPGVKTVGEASTGLNVRGGSADQNLILFNEATIFNPSHFFGLFSAFNPEVVKDVELYKSSIPARYGRPPRIGTEYQQQGRKQKKYYRLRRDRLTYEPAEHRGTADQGQIIVHYWGPHYLCKLAAKPVARSIQRQ